MARKNDRTYRVLRIDDGVLVLAECFAGRQACEKWIKGSGDEGYTYQVAVFVGAPIRVHIEQVQKRTLAPAAAEPEPEASAE